MGAGSPTLPLTLGVALEHEDQTLPFPIRVLVHIVLRNPRVIKMETASKSIVRACYTAVSANLVPIFKIGTMTSIIPITDTYIKP